MLTIRRCQHCVTLCSQSKDQVNDSLLKMDWWKYNGSHKKCSAKNCWLGLWIDYIMRVNLIFERLHIGLDKLFNKGRLLDNLNSIESIFFLESQVGFFVYHSYVLSSFQLDSIAPHCSFLIYKPDRREEVMLVYNVHNSHFLSNGRCGGSSPTSLCMLVLST